MKKIYGTYLNSAGATIAVEELLDKGYTRDEIKVISKNALNLGLEEIDENVLEDDKNLWEKIKDAFTFHEYNDENFELGHDEIDREVLEIYKPNLKAGEIIILVEEKEGFGNKTPDWDEREREFYEDLD